MTVQGRLQTHVLAYPLTLEVDIERSTLSSLNTATFTLYNLSPNTRADIEQDRWEAYLYRSITLVAGYQSWPSQPKIFQGNILQANSMRRGPDWVTVIEAMDGAFALSQGTINVPVDPGQSAQSLFGTLIAAMPKVTVGFISPNLQRQAVRSISLTGSPWDRILELARFYNAEAFIDHEQVYILSKDEFLPTPQGGISVVTDQTGLVNTPRRFNDLLEVDMIFEPRFIVGQFYNLNSAIAANNGVYKVNGIKHAGNISRAVDGGCITTVTSLRRHPSPSGVPA